jgi:hypothetical protein
MIWFFAGSVLGWVLLIADKKTPIDALKFGTFRKLLINIKGLADVSRVAGAPILNPQDLSQWKERGCPWCPSGRTIHDSSKNTPWAANARWAVISEGWGVFHPEHTAKKIDADTFAICDTAGYIQESVSRRGTLNDEEYAEAKAAQFRRMSQ